MMKISRSYMTWDGVTNPTTSMLLYIFFFQFLSFNCKWQISKDITYINNNYGPQFLRVFWTKNLRITALEHFKAYSIHTVRPLRANNYKFLQKECQMPVKNFKIMKVPGHHLRNTQYHSPKKAPDRSQEKKKICLLIS